MVVKAFKLRLKTLVFISGALDVRSCTVSQKKRSSAGSAIVNGTKNGRAGSVKPPYLLAKDERTRRVPAVRRDLHVLSNDFLDKHVNSITAKRELQGPLCYVRNCSRLITLQTIGNLTRSTIVPEQRFGRENQCSDSPCTILVLTFKPRHPNTKTKP